MNKQLFAREHRRNRSELQNYAPSSLKPKKKEKITLASSTQNKKRASSNSKKTLHPQLVNTLLNKSTKKAARKKVVIEQIDDFSQSEQNDEFFCFGKGIPSTKFRYPIPNMEEIIQVPDAGSYSHRNTEDNKQNISSNLQFTRSNRKEGPLTEIDQLGKQKFFRLNLSKQPLEQVQNVTVSMLSQRQNNNSSRKQSNRSHDYSQSQSTIELSKPHSRKSKNKSKTKISRQSLNSKSEIATLRQQTQRIQKNIRMIWQCMGQIWQTSRTNKYVSQKHQQKINDLNRKQQLHERQLLELKLEHSKRNKESLRY